MPDKSSVFTASASLRTGRGQLIGAVITNSSGTVATATFYDNTAGSGTKILEAHVSSTRPLELIFSERMALDFSTGLYLSLGSNLSATVWWREY